MTQPDHTFSRATGRIPLGFAHEPQPRSIGSVEVGQRIAAGLLLFGGQRIERTPAGPRLWDLPMGPAAQAEAQGMGWLDDLAAAGGIGARQVAQAAVFGWIDRDEADGWPDASPARDPALGGRRVLRWVHHAGFLTQHRRKEDQRRFAAAIRREIERLAQSAPNAPAGPARAEALAGLICGAAAIEGARALAGPAGVAMEGNVAALIGAEGVASRSPEDLLAAFEWLLWSADALAMAGQMAGGEHLAALSRAARWLRGLRLADGRLARCHGGGRGAAGRLDHALADSGLRIAGTAQAMGFVRLAAGRSTLVLDAAPPPATGDHAQASTLGFEMSFAGRMLVTSGGEGARFGPAWARAVRATAMASAPGLAGLSAARARLAGGPLIERPGRVWLELGGDGHSVVAGHDGYGASHGLAVVRSLTLADDGLRLEGADGFAPLPGQRPAPDALAEVRFHVPPEAQVASQPESLAATICLPATVPGRPDEIWIFQHDGSAELLLEPSAALEGEAEAPQPAVQIVLRAPIADGHCRIGWVLARG